MKDSDFYECRFIRDELSFLTYFDFCENARILKLHYQNLGDNAKIFYKWYVYANIHMGEHYKNKIWDYLNDETEEEYQNLIDNQKTYKLR